MLVDFGISNTDRVEGIMIFCRQNFDLELERTTTRITLDIVNVCIFCGLLHNIASHSVHFCFTTSIILGRDPRHGCRHRR